MRKKLIYSAVCWYFTILSVQLNAQLTASVGASSYCQGTTVSVSYSSSATFNSGNIFTAQLSDASGSFASPATIGTLSSTSANGSISTTIPAVSGTGFRIRVVSSNPAITGSNNGSNINISEPPAVYASIMIYSGPGDENEVCRYEGNIIDFSYTANTTPTWSAVSHQGGSWPSWTPWSNDDLYVEFFTGAQNTLILHLDATNSCATVSYDFGFKAIDCTPRMASPKSFKVSPNPANNIINISPLETTGTKAESKLISYVTISDISNNIISMTKFGNVKNATLSIASLKPGTYFVKITSGNYSETQTILKM
jgi:hypothetical protein